MKTKEYGGDRSSRQGEVEPVLNCVGGLSYILLVQVYVGTTLTNVPQAVLARVGPQHQSLAGVCRQRPTELRRSCCGWPLAESSVRSRPVGLRDFNSLDFRVVQHHVKCRRHTNPTHGETEASCGNHRIIYQPEHSTLCTPVFREPKI